MILSRAGRPVRTALWICVALAPALGACQRARPTAPRSDALSSSAAITVSAPASGATVASPLAVAGTARLDPATQTLVGMVFSVDPSGERWRGNASIPVRSDGSFAGSIAYTTEAAGDGIVQLAVIDGAAGTVMTRQRVNVQLAAAPAP